MELKCQSKAVLRYILETLKIANSATKDRKWGFTVELDCPGVIERVLLMKR